MYENNAFSFFGLLLGVLLCGFTCKPPKGAIRPVASIIGTAVFQKPDNTAIESLSTGLAELVKARGFHDLEDQSAFYLKDGFLSVDNNFWLAPSFSCNVRVDRESVNVKFHEWKTKSGIFQATEKQRASVRVLANDIKAYLDDRMPATYEIHVPVYKPVTQD